MTPVLTRRLPRVLLALLVGQVVVASAALAAPAAPKVPAAPVGPTPLQVEQKLADLHYDVGAVDGVYDDATGEAVMAFQKVIGMDRTGKVDDHVAQIILSVKTPPAPLVPGGGANRVEVDLVRQVLFLYEGDTISRILMVSSGTSRTPTPTGSYAVYSQSKGWETSPLGQLYNSQYFVGGYAIHGSKSVPPTPASHGCIRISMRAADWLPSHVTIGTPVFVLGG